MSPDVNQGSDDEDRSPLDQEPSDQSLLRRVRHGNQDAASHLYRRYARRLQALVRAKFIPDLASRVDQEDIVQSVFGSFFRGVNRGSYDVPAGEELWNLFMVITLNKIRAKGVYHRATKRDVRQTIGGNEIGQYCAIEDSDSATNAYLRLAVEEALDRLPSQHRLVVQLRMEGHEVVEIAEQTGRSKRSVERLLQECREKLGRLLEDPGNDAIR